MKKLIVLLLAVGLLCTVFAGCTTTAPVATTVAATTAAETAATSLPKDAVSLPGSTVSLNVRYAMESEAQRLDIYVPDTGEGPFPVIFAIHGGAFGGGDKQGSTVILKMQLEGLNRGYAVVSVNYRLSGEAIFPAAVFDLKCALRFIKANAATYNLDPERIVVWGDSAGGNLAAMLGTSAGVAELEDLTMGYADQDTTVAACVCQYGAIDFLSMLEQNNKESSPGSPESVYLGANITDIPEIVAQSNPETYITADDPPFYLCHGTADLIVPMQQSVDFAADLRAVIGEDMVTFDTIEGVGHANFAFGYPENTDKVYAFLDKYLK